MSAEIITPEEQERLADLQSLNLLDTPNEKRLDFFTHLAAKLLHAPMATISLVDVDRQWFKSRVGIELCQTDRNISFCTHTIRQEGPFIIEDTLLDSRFSENLLVKNPPHIRFYAGHPLHGPRGHRIGSLCILDTHPRKLTSDEIELLQELALLTEKGLQTFDLIDLQKRLLEAQKQILQSRERLSREVKEAAQFVTSLLPQPLESPIHTRHLYTPSSELGGDCFHYHWVNDDLFAFYGIDVAGHGISSALLAISVLNALNALVRLRTDTITPHSTLELLNDAFPMAKQGNRFTTAWVGFYRPSTRTLEYSGAAHPSPLHFRWAADSGKPKLTSLAAKGLPLGILPDQKYESHQIPLQPGDHILLFSDGIYEVGTSSGWHGTYEDFCFHVYSASEKRRDLFNAICECHLAKKDEFKLDDDITLVEFEF